MLIRPATKHDEPAIWSILEPTIRAGETNAIPRDLNEAGALAYWLARDHEVFVAEEEEDEDKDEEEKAGRIVGTYYLRPNQAGGGAHVANCGYMTAAAATGRGIARRMCEHSLLHARARGYRAMQFNFVISTNERAVHLWQALGFEVLARLPLAFLHPARGYVDALVMFQSLVPV